MNLTSALEFELSSSVFKLQINSLISIILFPIFLQVICFFKYLIDYFCHVVPIML